MFYVYVIHNIKNNKIYVGKTQNPTKRWNKHIKIALGNRTREKFYIHRAIAKYGVDNFVFSIVQKLYNESEINSAETYWIDYFKSKDTKYGYNLTEGGEGVSGRIVSEETREKIRQKAIGRKHSQETINIMSGENNHRSKLTLKNVIDIRYKYNILNNKLKTLSEKYNISSRSISRIIYNQDWYDNQYTPPVPRKINSSGKPKLTLEQADKIRKMYGDGAKLLELSKIFNVTKENIFAIINNKIWKRSNGK